MNLRRQQKFTKHGLFNQNFNECMIVKCITYKTSLAETQRDHKLLGQVLISYLSENARFEVILVVIYIHYSLMCIVYYY